MVALISSLLLKSVGSHRLRDEKHQILLNDAEEEEAVRQADKLMDFIKTLPTGITEYDDILVRKLIEKIIIAIKT